ncbi:hypothetical protein [Nitrosopumilus adriaticus]|uniref:Methyltransferase type 12 n=1 Tax=Nitrosopumilus adriaticus TaxID=1580092 RepID=A0A0D5C1M9_9ARCH|nr:hypothetical protein [Nitrosopumilus adriaticus]AJW70709.1 hypothetical protein NADRNF5_1018 [Nitrosopumilus adriaticus]
MNELKIKKDFTDIYTEDSPHSYLKEMNRLKYSISDSTKILYNAIIEELEEKLSRPVNVLDLGSSYGINSSLIKYNLTMSELSDFFLNGTEPTKKEIKQFYEECTSNDNINFYQIDISEEALKFSEEMNLCERGMNVDLEDDKLNLLGSLPKMDLIIATGCVGYIGYKAFLNLLKVIKNRQSNSKESETVYTAPIFAFSILRMFDMKDIEEVFEMYDYSIAKSDIEPIHQRSFSGPKEKEQTISLLNNMEINTKEYEDDGNFYADFYIARSNN